MKESVRYLKYIFGIVIFVLLSIGTFNWFIDPFEIYWTGEYKPHRKIFMKKVWILMISGIPSGGAVQFSYAEKLCFTDVLGKSSENHTKM